MKKLGFNGQLRNKIFLIVIHRFQLVNAAMNALGICKMCNGVRKNALNFFFFQLSKCAMNISAGLSEVGGRADFLKDRRASLFNDSLSNEPNFGRIHRAGQYIKVSKITILVLF
jgi:hypothetical protein